MVKRQDLSKAQVIHFEFQSIVDDIKLFVKSGDALSQVSKELSSKLRENGRVSWWTLEQKSSTWNFSTKMLMTRALNHKELKSCFQEKF